MIVFVINKEKKYMHINQVLFSFQECPELDIQNINLEEIMSRCQAHKKSPKIQPGNYIHSVLVQDFVSGQDCNVNQYNCESP